MAHTALVDNSPLAMALSPLLDRYEHVLLDLDGCVYVGEHAIDGSPEAVAALRSSGRSVSFLTNDARLAPEEYVRKLWSLGCTAAVEEVVTVGSAIQHVLADEYEGRTAFVIGSDAIFRHVSDAGLRIVNATDGETLAEVVVLAGHDDLHFAELRAATQAVLAGAALIAAGRDRTFPMPDGPWPGTGALVAAVEYSTGAVARSVGKPDPQLFRTALDRLAPGRSLVIGDRLDSDLAGAAAAGLDAAIVLSGVTTAEEVAAAEDPAPVAVGRDLKRLVIR
jgi:HAD superfamily hydrolase (TIGR01450 family)